jgi:hypothetical protein
VTKRAWKPPDHARVPLSALRLKKNEPRLSGSGSQRCHGEYGKEENRIENISEEKLKRIIEDTPQHTCKR